MYLLGQSNAKQYGNIFKRYNTSEYMVVDLGLARKASFSKRAKILLYIFNKIVDQVHLLPQFESRKFLYIHCASNIHFDMFFSESSHLPTSMDGGLILRSEEVLSIRL